MGTGISGQSEGRKDRLGQALSLLTFFTLNPLSIAFGQEQTVLFDFGRHDNGTNGAVVSTNLLNTNNTAVGPGTAVGDGVSYVWNSLGGTNQTQSGSGVYFSQFRDQNSNAVSWAIGDLNSVPTQANGFLNGGLKLVTGQATSLNPSYPLLGKLAVANATGDYWFVDNTVATNGGGRAGFRLTGLDTSKRYRFTLFASRNSTGSRFTRYQISGNNTVRGFLQSSGLDIGAGNGVGTDTNKYDGNDARTLTLPAVTPLPDGTLSLAWYGRSDTNFPEDFSATNAGNSFGYLNLMQVEVFPAGHTTYLIDIGGDTTTASVGGEPSASTNGVFWNNSAGPGDGSPNSLTNLLSSEGQTSNITMTWTATGAGVGGAVGGWGVSFGPNGSPLNVSSAFKDGIFVDSARPARFVLGNLQTNLSYRLEFFGSRSTTNEVRASKYRVVGATTNELIQTNTGTDVGGPGIPYNRSVVATEVFSASNGTISVDITVQQGTYGYLNAVTLSANLSGAPVSGLPTTPPSILIDFGGIGGNTNQLANGLVPTPSPDLRGFYWNNSSGGDYGNPSNLDNLVDQLNQPSGVRLTWGDRGAGVAASNLGISSIPTNSPLYGFFGSPLGVSSAMQDGVYNTRTDTDNWLTLEGLDPAKVYDLSIFASRSDPVRPRYSDYLVRGATDTTNLITTSGPNFGGTGIHYNVTPWNLSVQPDANGKIFVYYRGASNGPLGPTATNTPWAYLNAMSIRPSAVQIPVITSVLTASIAAGSDFTYTITASGTPSSFDALGLPEGLSIDPVQGVISGRPANPGDYSVSLSASNLLGTGSATLLLTVADPAVPVPVITSPLSASGVIGFPFQYQIAANNSPTSFSSSALPAGLSLDSATGLISGRPSTLGTNSVALAAANSFGTGSANLVISIQAPTYSRWTSARGLSGASTNTLADPDGNGMGNLLEYCFLSDPTNPAARSIRPVLSESNGYLTLAYLRRTNDSSVAIRAEFSPSLDAGSWISETVGNGPVAVATNSLPGNEGVQVTVRAPLTKAAAPKGFLRAVVSQPTNQVLVVGSSTMALWSTMGTDLAPVPILNKAISGTVTSQWLSTTANWTNRVVSQTNTALIYYCGSNDIGNSSTTPATPSATIVSNTVAFFQDFWTRYPDAPALYVAIQKAPVKKTAGRLGNVDEVNNLMKDWIATQPRARYVDCNPVMVDATGTALPGMFLSDNLHPSAQGYQAMTQVIKPVLQEMWYYQAR